MSRGRFQIGEYVQLGVLCLNSSGVPVAPDAAPTVDVYQGNSLLVSRQLMPCPDPFGAPAWFQYALYLDGRFVAGKAMAVCNYLISGQAYASEEFFDVLPGGSIDGQVLAQFWYPRPQASFIVYQTSDGEIFHGRNPSV